MSSASFSHRGSTPPFSGWDAASWEPIWIPSPPINALNFRRKMLEFEILQPLDARRRVGVQRPARLYKFSATEFEKLPGRGMVFPF